LAYCLDGDGAQAKQDLLKEAIAAVRRCEPVYRMAHDRWVSGLNTPAKETVFVPWRLAIGLGIESVLETGITLHRTYGTPLIPGSALKGLAAHYCHSVWGAADQEYVSKGSLYREMFGVTADAGHITFHDAWILPDSLRGNDSGLVLDVMTPHHGDYYMSKEDSQPPSDYDDPTPVPFLSVRGKFCLAVTCDGDGVQADNWAKRALALLKEALKEWGVGGKTNSGYGRIA
jgi:CRISPR-associated protein Cmr6